MTGRQVGRAATPVVFVGLVTAGVVALLAYLPTACSARPYDPEVAWPLLYWATIVVAALATSSMLYQRTLVRSGDRRVWEAAAPLVVTVVLGVATTWVALGVTEALGKGHGCLKVFGSGEPAMLPMLLVYFGIPFEAVFFVAVGIWVFLYARPTSWY